MLVRGLEAHTSPWIRAIRYRTQKSKLSKPSRRFFSSTFAKLSQMDQLLYTCDVDAEPLYRYRRGGYHPVYLGDVMNGGRYQILHKLGWGGYSTAWAARDQRFGVALPRGVCEADQDLSLRTRRKKPRTRSHASDSIGSPRLSASDANAGSL